MKAEKLIDLVQAEEKDAMRDERELSEYQKIYHRINALIIESQRVLA